MSLFLVREKLGKGLAPKISGERPPAAPAPAQVTEVSLSTAADVSLPGLDALSQALSVAASPCSQQERC